MEEDDPELDVYDEEDAEHAAWCGADCDGTLYAEGGTYRLPCDCACHDTIDQDWW